MISPFQFLLPKRALIIAGLLVLCASWFGALAQDAPEDTQILQDPATGTELEASQSIPLSAANDAEQELAEIERAMSISQERADFLRREMEELSGNRAQQNAALIAAAQRVRLAEIEVGSIEERMIVLLASESEIRTRLDGADVNVAILLSALQRISKNPPPALIINPSDALSSARTALLLSAVLPELRDKAAIVTADLRELVVVKEAVAIEQATLTARFTTLQEEQLRIATLIEARRRGVERVEEELLAQEQEAEALASEATSLNQLITALRARIETVNDAANAAEALPQIDGADLLSADEIQIALADTDRTSPAFAFSSARGLLTNPATGVTITEFGVDDGFGGIASGTSIVTRAEAQVVAPADAWVMYKGPYLNYGQIIILNPGDGYTILLAGLDAINVDLGDFVLMGQPVGTMGSRTLGRTVSTNAGISRPTLYIEIRNQDVPQDPAIWWARQVGSPPISDPADGQTETG